MNIKVNCYIFFLIMGVTIMMSSDSCFLERAQLEKVNQFSDMSDVTFKHCPFSDSKIPKNDLLLLYKDQGLALILATVKTLFEASSEGTLKTVSDAVSERVSLTSRYSVQASPDDSWFKIVSRQESISVILSIKNIFEDPPFPASLPSRYLETDHKKELCIEAIFKGHHERQERLADIHNKFNDELKTEIPEDLVFLIFSYLSEYRNIEENTKLIKEAKQKYVKGCGAANT